MAFQLTNDILLWYNILMKNIATIDSAGRFVVPKWMRNKFEFIPGQKIKLTEFENGILISAALPKKREFVKKGQILTIDTGGGSASPSDFDIDKYRDQKIDKLIYENWH